MRPLISRCALGAAAVLALTLVAPVAQAADVDDAREQVKDLGREVEIAAEEYNDVRVELEAQQGRAEAAKARVAGQATKIDLMQDELGSLAVETFKRGGVDPQLMALIGSGSAFTSSSATLTVMAERSSLTLTDLKAAQEKLVTLEADADSQLEQVVALEADAATRKAAIEAQLDDAKDVLAAAEAEAARIEAERRAAAEQATRARERAALAAAEQAAAEQAAAEQAAQSAAAPSRTQSRSQAQAPSAPATASRSRSSAPAPAAAAPAAPAVPAPAAEASYSSAGTINCGGVMVDAPNARAATAISFACSQMGKPYLFGSSGPSSYDCSGLTSAAWAAAGVSLPHSSRAQAGYGTPVSRSQLLPGDLVFGFSPISHVGIYIGGGRMVAAPSAGDVVKIQSLQYIPFNSAVRL